MTIYHCDESLATTLKLIDTKKL